jgi:hypothetical protein
MRALPKDAKLFSSHEPKAWQTLSGSTQVTRDHRFNEVSRSAEPWDGNFQEFRRRYVEGATHAGWEPPAEAASRFQAGVFAALSGHHATHAPTVIATHGMVLTVWLVSIDAVPSTSAAQFWSHLRFPDCLLVDTANLRVRTCVRSTFEWPGTLHLRLSGAPKVDLDSSRRHGPGAGFLRYGGLYSLQEHDFSVLG